MISAVLSPLNPSLEAMDGGGGGGGGSEGAKDQQSLTTVAFASQPGRKHAQTRVNWNEDRAGSVKLHHLESFSGRGSQQGEDTARKSSPLGLAAPPPSFHVLYVADGHGETPKPRHMQTNAEIFMDHLQACLPDVIEQVLADAHREWLAPPDICHHRDDDADIVYSTANSGSSINGGLNSTHGMSGFAGMILVPNQTDPLLSTDPSSSPISTSRDGAVKDVDVFAIPASPEKKFNSRMNHTPIHHNDATSSALLSSLSKANSRSIESSNKRLVDLISEHLKHLDQRLNAVLDQEIKPICRDNGSTLVAALVCPEMDSIWMLNIGDSSMMLFSQRGEPLKVWKLAGSDAEPSICSFEDTLGAWPFAVQEGQSWAKVKTLWERVCFHVRENRELGSIQWRLVSDQSQYGLCMINSLGNRNHGNVMLNTTTVYHMSLSELYRVSAAVDNEESDESVSSQEGGEEMGRAPFQLVLVSDGVKDVLSTRAIGLTIQSLERAVLHLLCTSRPSLSPTAAAQMDISEALDLLAPGNQSDSVTSSAKAALLDVIMDEGPRSVQEAANTVISLAALLGSRDDLTCLLCSFSPSFPR